ncbi:NADH-azoreductase FMN-dependent [Carpediemonas membranifera]|uniref:FMN-dependent NADH-azoreductase n=1 Tax=Carpediemonas membranifera TaxID=201153 RepID=A0A8J6E1B1_9EUKA|nr:NADH-azoreductase FMN-dependent [Carpediemonas membranifera]|eukprot:KAG9396129.1 NADH-azoreductase FMN-dependent [Carpediemonas membranifera]
MYRPHGLLRRRLREQTYRQMAKKILAIKSSILGANSQSSQLIDYLLEGLDGDVTVRDVAAEPLPMLDLETMTALSAEPNDIQQLSDKLIQEVKDADLVVIGAPNYNFAIPTQLKNWIDLIARAGVTFRYSSGGGVEGLVTNTCALVIATSGGMKKDNNSELGAPYLKSILGFMGIPTEFIFVEGLGMSKVKEAALAKAKEELKAYKCK